MQSILKLLKNALSLERYQRPLTESDRQLLNRLAREIIQREMQIPAIFILESAKPLSYLGSQALAFFQPILSGLFVGNDYKQIQNILERSHSIDFLLQILEKQQEKHGKELNPCEETNH